jgi:hypothetical protein
MALTCDICCTKLDVDYFTIVVDHVITTDALAYDICPTCACEIEDLVRDMRLRP